MPSLSTSAKRLVAESQTISPELLGVSLLTSKPPRSAITSASCMVAGLPSVISSAARVMLMFLTSAVSLETFALFTTLTKVGISTAARIATTAITITNSTIVKPFLFAFFIGFYSFLMFFCSSNIVFGEHLCLYDNI